MTVEVEAVVAASLANDWLTGQKKTQNLVLGHGRLGRQVGIKARWQKMLEALEEDWQIGLRALGKVKVY